MQCYIDLRVYPMEAHHLHDTRTTAQHIGRLSTDSTGVTNKISVGCYLGHDRAHRPKTFNFTKFQIIFLCIQC